MPPDLLSVATYYIQCMIIMMRSIWRGRDLLKDTVPFAVMYLLPLSMSCVGTCCGLCNLFYTPPVQPYV